MPTLRKEIKLLLVSALWLIFGLGYFNHSPLPGFPVKLYLFFLAALVAGSAAGFGSLLIPRFLPATLSSAETLLFSVASGFGIMSLLMVLGGIFGLWTKAGVLTLIVLGLVLCWRKKLLPLPSRERIEVRDGLSSALRTNHPSSQPSPLKGEGVIPLFLIGIGAALSLLLVFTPPTYYDTLVYHFALPQAYIQAGHWIGRPELIYSAFPQTMEMLWTLGMLLAGDVMANLLGWIIAVLGVLAVYLLAKRFFGQSTAAWAAAFLSVMPAYLLLSSGGYVDVGLTVFSFLSFYVLCLWFETDSLKILALAGFFAGCAVGSKYTGAIPLAIGALIILMKTRSRPLTKMIGPQTVYGGCALLIVTPWFLKNLYYVGNPFFPFFYSLSIKHLNPWMGEAAAGYFRGLTEYEPRSGLHLIKLLWDIVVNGLNFGGGMDVLGDLGWAPLFVFLPAIWLARKKPALLSVLLFYGVCFFVPWGMSRPVLRFLLPLAPILAIAAAYGYDQGVREQTRGFRLVGQAFLALLVLSNLRLFFDVSDALSLFKVPLGFESRADYLSGKLSYYAAASFINTLPEDSLTYVVGDQCAYYYNTPVIVTPVFNKNPLTEWANEASSPEDLDARLKARHVTHLLINYAELKRLDLAYHLFPFTPQGQTNWNGILARLARSVYRDSHCEVFAL